jgi:outer membrane protein TolC
MHPAVRSPRRAAGLVLAACFGLGMSAAALPAQEKVAPPVATASAAPLTLDDLLQLGTEKQPALAAARASLAAAQDGQQGLNNLPIYAKALTRDFPQRRQQACLGVTIAQASLWQAEWEARYAITRNYYSVLYVRLQQALLKDVIAKLSNGRDKADKMLKAGEGKVTKIDIELLDINIEFLKVKGIEAGVGGQKALAALREAIGVGPEYPLTVADGTLPVPLATLDKEELIRQAIANRGEIVQATSASRVTELEITAQSRKWFSLKVPTFASGSDIHATPIPQGVANGEYRPGAIGLEMPSLLVGKRDDRIAHAADLSQRASAVVDKALNLVALETENSYLKWIEARDRLTLLNKLQPRAREIADKILKRITDGNASGADYIQAVGFADQIQAQQNEALYLHALSLAALERITAGGYRIYPTK